MHMPKVGRQNRHAALGILTVAEGIEVPAQARRLRALGCELGQGYGFSEPLTAEEARGLLESRSRLGDERPLLVVASA